MQDNLEQYTLQFCVKLGKTAKESGGMLRAYGDSLISLPKFYHWCNTFRDGQESVIDKL